MKDRKVPPKPRSHVVIAVDSDVDEKDLPGLPALPTTALSASMTATQVRVMRDALTGGGQKMGKAKFGGNNHKTAVLGLMSGALNATCSSGVFMAAHGLATLTGAPDWTASISLFEIFRVLRAHLHYEPYVASQWTTGQALHGPFFLTYDPTLAATAAFTTLVGSRLLTDKRNHYTHTGKSVRKSWKLTEKALSIAAGGSALVSTLGQWNSASMVGAVAIQGAVLLSAATNTANAGFTYGVYVIQFDVEFGYRV